MAPPKKQLTNHMGSGRGADNATEQKSTIKKMQHADDGKAQPTSTQKNQKQGQATDQRSCRADRVAIAALETPGTGDRTPRRPDQTKQST